jgi:tetratricopeptide (TPR) repeat protein
MGVSTIHAGNRFQSDLTLFAPEVKRDPRFSEAWFYVGNYYRMAGNLNAADSAYDSGLAPAPGVIRFFDRTEFLINKSNVAVRRGDLAAADSLMRIAQSGAPDALQPDIAYIRADIAARRGDYDAVIALLSTNENNLRRPEARRLLDRALSEQRRP